MITTRLAYKSFYKIVKISSYFILEPKPSLISQHLLLDVLMAMISWFLRYFLVLSLKSRWENEGLVLCLNISSSPLSFYGRSCRAFSFQCFLFFILQKYIFFKNKLSLSLLSLYNLFIYISYICFFNKRSLSLFLPFSPFTLQSIYLSFDYISFALCAIFGFENISLHLYRLYRSFSSLSVSLCHPPPLPYSASLSISLSWRVLYLSYLVLNISLYICIGQA